MLIGDRWVEAVIGHIAGGDVVEDPPLLEKEVIEERVVTPPPKIRPVSLEKARRQLDELLLRAKEGEADEDPRVAHLRLGRPHASRTAVPPAPRINANDVSYFSIKIINFS